MRKTGVFSCARPTKTIPSARGKARAVRGRDVLLALARMEGDQRNALGLHERVDGGAKPLADGLHQRRRREGLTAVGAKEVDHPTLRLQAGDVEVEVQPVDALERPGDVVLDDVGNRAW